MSQHLFATIRYGPLLLPLITEVKGMAAPYPPCKQVTRGNDQYTTVSAEAISLGLSGSISNPLKPEETNRTFDPDKDQYNFKDEAFNPNKYIDDDLFGYMDAKKGSDNKDATTKRRGVLEVSRAISLDPYWGDVVFGSKGGTKSNTSIHNTEVHLTAYQYTLALTPENLKDTGRAGMVIDAISGIRHRSAVTTRVFSMSFVP